MMEALVALPKLLGCLVFMAFTIALGLAVYFATSRLHTRHQSVEAVEEIEKATGNLMRVMGWLFTLLLLFTFARVANEYFATKSMIEREAASIANVSYHLEQFGQAESLASQTRLVDYTQAVIEHDWPALANDQLSAQGNVALRRLEDSVFKLKAADVSQELVRAWLIEEVHKIADNRLSCLPQSRKQPPLVLLIILFGYLITMVYFGVYRPYPILLLLMAFYTAFVGVVVYLLLALSDPFQGAMHVTPMPLEYALQGMQAEMSRLPR